jgi:hypothetical protein
VVFWPPRFYFVALANYYQFMKFLCAIAIFCLTTIASADSWWSIELRTGAAKSFTTGLEIEQAGLPKIDFDAHYENHPWEDSFYYGWRISRSTTKHAWDVEFLHHKLYLSNNPPEVDHFEVSHGYNMLTFNHAWIFGSTYVRAGVGPVISHAETRVRGQFLDSGYELSGFTGQGSIEKHFYLSRKFFITVEGKFTLATASVSVANGDAHVPNIAIHGLAGLGYDFGKSD